jgi:hypothetical protein
MSQLFGIVMTALALALPAPAAAQRVTERLDRETGVTVTTQGEPTVFARNQPQFSRSARDYLYLGPFEINRRGQRTYYLWVGVGTTIDRGYLAPSEPDPQTLYVSVRDELVELPLHRWSELELATDSIYETRVRLRAEFFARVTLDQLRLLANAEPSEVIVKTADQAIQRYASWATTQPSWKPFVEHAAGPERETQNRNP